MTVKATWYGDQIKQQVRAATAQGLYLAAEVLLARSREIVPWDESTLAKSGAASVDAAQQVAAVSYDTVYAVVQHERLDYHHRAGRQAKYLEQPLGEMQPQIKAAIESALRGVLG